jgi:type II secretory pathway component PulM
MEYQTIKENGKVKFVVLPIKSFRALLDRLEDKSDLQALRVKQATVAKWERQGAVYRKRTREKLAKVFAVDEEVFL